jgi:predicted type IV restriction endonuclease
MKEIKNRDYKNPSERTFQDNCDRVGISYYRRGYPDFMILKDDEIVGFVEVKPIGGQQLKPSQERFERFCQRYGIPFTKWTPGDPKPEWIN